MMEHHSGCPSLVINKIKDMPYTLHKFKTIPGNESESDSICSSFFPKQKTVTDID